MKRIVLDQGLPATAVMICATTAGMPFMRESQMREATGLEILDFAARESRVVITLDRDFPQIPALTAATARCRGRRAHCIDLARARARARSRIRSQK